jgi:hypothetical protein
MMMHLLPNHEGIGQSSDDKASHYAFVCMLSTIVQLETLDFLVLQNAASAACPFMGLVIILLYQPLDFQLCFYDGTL